MIDVKSTYQYTIAICCTDNEQLLLIITNWCRLYHVPGDIIKIITSFCKKSVVYSTTSKLGTGHPKNAELKNKYGWNEIKGLKNCNIIQLAANISYSLFLEDNGVLWYCGEGFYR